MNIEAVDSYRSDCRRIFNIREATDEKEVTSYVSLPQRGSERET
jgi:hypothetical protein